MESLFTKRNRNDREESKHEPKIAKKTKQGPNSYINKYEAQQKKKQERQSKSPDLRGSKFRVLNEYLYTNDSSQAVDFFKESPEMFDAYHEGFRKQMQTWPRNPLHTIISQLKKEKKYDRSIICDLGCGEGKLYEHMQENGLITGNKVVERLDDCNTFKEIRSFDLVSIKPHITSCDIAHLNLPNQYSDVAIFCLALMGTNYIDFILEAKRILKMGGFLIISEVVSRFSDLRIFVKMIKSFGFVFHEYLKKNSFFIILVFRKAGDPKIKPSDTIHLTLDKKQKGPLSKLKTSDPTFSKLSEILLKPCIYKRR